MGKIFQVIVIGIKGEKKTVDIAHSESDFDSTTVAIFKKKLMEKCPELKEENFTMMYTDRKLEDGDTFSSYGIKDRSTIMLILRLPGGSAF
ncbi:hypothetical protein NFI96_019450 [Prochilodus magdalenae]|nr:hypothetical protein NFI96_019450 [Prochilodus magdalenae]